MKGEKIFGQEKNLTGKFFVFLNEGKNAYYTLSLTVLITLLWIPLVTKTSFNYDIESFFASDDPEVEAYHKFKRNFGNENDMLLVGIKSQSCIFSRDFLVAVDSITRSLAQLGNVKKVISPVSLKNYIISPLLGPTPIPLIHIDDTSRYASDKKGIYGTGEYVGSFFSSDTSSISLVMHLSKDLSYQENELLHQEINHILTRTLPYEFHLAGRIHTQHHYILDMKKEMAAFSLLALFLFIATMFGIFRSVKLILIPLLIVIISLLWIFGIISLFDIRLDLMLTLLPTLIFVLSTSVSIHFITRFREVYSEKDHKLHAIKQAFIQTTIPNFMNALTTSVGFASLALIPIIPIQRFGLLAAVGVLISFFIGIILIPVLLRFMVIEPLKIKTLNPTMKPLAIRILNLVSVHRLGISGISLVLILISIVASFNIKIDNKFLDDLNPTSILKTDLEFFEERFAGIRPFEVMVAPAGQDVTVLDFRSIWEIERVENYLRTEYQTGYLFSPVHIIKSLNKAVHGGNGDFYQLPEDEITYNRLIQLADKYNLWDRAGSMVSKDKSMVRISGRALDIGSSFYQEKNSGFDWFIQNNTQQLQFNLTGAAQLMDNANHAISRYLTRGILLAVLIAGLVIWIFFRSFKLTILSLMVNMIPLILVAGIMGFFGIPLKVVNALVFTIIYGIAVDDTIHFLNSYNSNITKSNRLDAISLTILQMTSPMVFTSAILFAGFMIFSFSDFMGIKSLGLLTGVSLVVALVADLILLPVLLQTVIGKKKVRLKEPDCVNVAE